jgi:hypothetical protein
MIERYRGVVICVFRASKTNSIDGAAANGSNMTHGFVPTPEYFI